MSDDLVLRLRDWADERYVIQDGELPDLRADLRKAAKRIEALAAELAAFTRGVRVTIPSEAMEAEFTNQRRMGVEQGRRERIEADRDAMQQALEALKDPCYDARAIRSHNKAIAALQERLK